MKRVPLYKKYAETRPCGVYTLCNWGGLSILDIEYGFEDYAVVCFDFGNSRQQIRRHKIQRTASGRPFIRKQGRRYYFDQIMKV